MIKQWVCLIMLTYSVAVLAADKSVMNAAHEPQLSPDTVQSIQFIGRSILAAKHSEQPSQQTQQVKQRLENLHQSIEDMYAESVKLSASDLTVNNQVPSGRLAKETLKEKDVDQSNQRQMRIEQKASLTRQRLDEMKSDRRFFQSQVNTTDSADPRQPQMHNLLAKTDSLTMEVEDALSSSGDDRAAKLETLRDKLKTKSFGDLPHPTEPVPTITTIVRHRQ